MASVVASESAPIMLPTGRIGPATDRTPDMVRPLPTAKSPVRQRRSPPQAWPKGAPTAALSRGLAGVAGRALNQPGVPPDHA